ncbi:MAG TPA: hypothetical protein VKA85_08645 [Candidatus Limnocylindrales bacterium]|nr:hypothetical protein [Candidatus Limnocylindrales bacterium]
MPDISFPEVRLPELKLPEGLREMNREDIQKAIPEVRLPRIELPRRGDVSKELAKASKELGKAGKDLDKVIPRRAGPSPIPFVVLGVLAGLFAGWFLASSPTMAPRIGSVADALRARIDRWRNGSALDDEDLELGSTSYPDALRSPLQVDTSMTTSVEGIGSPVAVGPGVATNGIGTGAEGVSSERF